MGRRLELQSLLEVVLGSRNVYYQPPTNVKINYPCIVYSRDKITTKFANNIPYLLRDKYMITAIDRNPDSVIPDKLSQLAQCLHIRRFVNDNLYHDTFSIYF